MSDINLIRYNLSFFADNDGGEKTEQPTSRKKNKARDEGQVAKSVELSTAALFLAAFSSLRYYSSWMFRNIENVFRYNFVRLSNVEDADNIAFMSGFLTYMFGRVLLIAAPIFTVVLIVGLIINIYQVKWKITTKPLMPKFAKLNPVSGIKRIFSSRSLIELPKSLAKLIIIGLTLYFLIVKEMPVIIGFMEMSLMQSMQYVGKTIIDMGIRIGFLYLIIAAVDYPYQKYKHTKSLKMTKQEVKDEYKMVEGDPKVKAKIRQKMRQASLRRMMQEVPGADVIITNPTHYSVALVYDKAESIAPVVVAKGVDYLARRIKEKAAECNIPIVEDKKLARTLYNTVDIGREVPVDLYQAVAEVLAFVYRLKNKGA